MQEEKLVEALKAGSEKAFSELVYAYQERVIATCYGFLHNQEEAEDVAQEVFIQVFRSIKKFRGDSRISTWLYRIAVNRSLNKIRSRRSTIMIAIDEMIGNTGSNRVLENKTPLDKLEDQERAAVLHRAIDQLPKNQRSAFILSKYDGLANKKIAEVMNTTLSAVEALLNRAKKNLQVSLVDYHKQYL